MKKFFLNVLPVLFVAALSVGFASCGNDDEKANPGDGSQGAATNSIIGTWRKYHTDSTGATTEQLGSVLWVFNADGTMQEHDIDAEGHIIENHTETFKYRTENAHLYTQKQKEGREYDWKDEGEYSIANNILEVKKSSGKTNRYKRV